MGRENVILFSLRQRHGNLKQIEISSQEFQMKAEIFFVCIVFDLQKNLSMYYDESKEENTSYFSLYCEDIRAEYQNIIFKRLSLTIS